MARLHVFGAGSGRPSARRDTTSLLFTAGSDHTLIDCGGAVVHRLARLGLEPEDLARVILTHDHVDHLYGLPHLLHALAIARCAGPLVIHAPPATLATVERLLAALGLDREEYPAIDGRPIEERAGAPVVDGADLRIRATPTAHGRDTRALRIEAAEGVIGHSSDTRFHEPLAELFAGADLVLHDCGGLERDRDQFAAQHSTAAEAGRIATLAGARELRLIHLSPLAEADEVELVAEAAAEFAGRIATARDGDAYRLPRPAERRRDHGSLE